MCEINLTYDDDYIIEPNFHDANIFGLITLENKKTLLILVKTVNKSLLCISLNDFDCFRADDFREGNIILDITVSSGFKVDMFDIAYAHGLEQFINIKNFYLENAVQNFVEGKRLFVQINPSYGCKLVCICGQIEILQNWPLLNFSAS